MSTFTEALRQRCTVEWERFAKGTRTETDDPQFKFVGEYWRSIGKNLDGRTVVRGIRPAWSSAFVSFVVRGAGAQNRFRYTEAHCHYVKAATDAAAGASPTHGYVARRSSEYAPKVGDIVVAGREYAKKFDFDQAKLIHEADSFYPSHGDIVVEVNPATGVIGGNVATDTVGRKQLRTEADGRLKDRVVGGVAHPLIAVLECRI